MTWQMISDTYRVGSPQWPPSLRSTKQARLPPLLANDHLTSKGTQHDSTTTTNNPQWRTEQTQAKLLQHQSRKEEGKLCSPGFIILCIATNTVSSEEPKTRQRTNNVLEWSRQKQGHCLFLYMMYSVNCSTLFVIMYTACSRYNYVMH